MKLNLGGRDTRLDGFLNVDCHDGPQVDIKADISALTDIGDHSVTEIYASHCLEHFPHVRTAAVLKEWRRVMMPRAKAYIAVPDVDAVVALFQKEGMTNWVRNILWGDQGYDKAFHYTGFTFSSLAADLVRAGFHDVRRLERFPHGLIDCSTLRIDHYDMPVSLNVEAVA
jgi:predicted SAM-dependent methyltransferase